jgi:predicted permease
MIFCGVVSAGAGLISGLAPAIHATRYGIHAILKEDGATGGGDSGRFRSALVVVQIGLSFLLMVSAGLMLRTLQKARSTDIGFQPAGLWIAAASTFGADQAGADAAAGTRLLERAQVVPGITAVGLGSSVPLVQGASRTIVHAGNDSIAAEYAVVAGDYFGALGLPVLRGRPLRPGDAARGQPSGAVINRALARRLWPATDPVGHTVIVNGQPLSVVGVTADAKYHELTEPAQPFLYLPYAGGSTSELYLVARSAGGAGTDVGVRLRRMLALDVPGTVVVVRPFTDAAAAALLPQRAAAAVTSIFGGLGILLAVVGLYAVVAYSVNQRARELGLRIALGAPPRSITTLVLRRALRLTAAGVLLGAVLAHFGVKLLRHLLFGVSGMDPVTYLLVVALLVAAALLAAYSPAQHALAVDPTRTLRPE